MRVVRAWREALEIDERIPYTRPLSVYLYNKIPEKLEERYYVPII